MRKPPIIPTFPEPEPEPKGSVPVPPGEETANSPVEDVQLDEPGWWPSCEAFLAHALRSEMTSKVWMEMYEDEAKREMARPFEAAFFSAIEDISEFFLAQPALTPNDLFDLIDRKRDDDRYTWAIMLANYPGTNGQDTDVWNQGWEWGYDTVVSLLREHLATPER